MSPTSHVPAAQLSATAACVEKYRSRGLLHGAVVCVRHLNIDVIEAFGELEPGVSATTDVVFPWLCASKPLLATAVLHLVGQGRLDLDVPVNTWLPDYPFATYTVRHLLTHMAGIVDAKDVQPPKASDAAITERVRTTGTARLPGTTASYSWCWSWYVLKALAERVTGSDIRDFYGEVVWPFTGGDPLFSEDVWRAHKRGEIGPIANLRILREPTRSLNLENHSLRRHRFNVNVASGLWGTVGQLRSFYDAVARARDGDPRGVPVPADLMRQATVGQRGDVVDIHNGRRSDWGLGFMVGMGMAGCGRRWGTGAYGHSASVAGCVTTLAAADPSSDTVAVVAMFGALAVDRFPREARLRGRRLGDAVLIDVSRLAADVKLTVSADIQDEDQAPERMSDGDATQRQTHPGFRLSARVIAEPPAGQQEL